MAKYPLVGFRFKVEFRIVGATSNDVRFQEVSGLTSSLGEFTVTEGGENRFIHRLPDRPSYGDLVLKRGVITETGDNGTSLVDSVLVQWFHNAIVNFVFTPADILIHALDEAENPIMTWSFRSAYPKGWTTTGFNAKSSEILVDEIKLSYRYFSRVL